MKGMTGNELGHSTIGKFIYYNNRGAKHTKSRIIRIRNVMYNEQKKALTQFYLKTGLHTDTHPPQEMMAAAFIDTPSSEGR